MNINDNTLWTIFWIGLFTCITFSQYFNCKYIHNNKDNNYNSDKLEEEE